MDWVLAAFFCDCLFLFVKLNITDKKKKKISEKELKQPILQCDTRKAGTVVEFSTPHSTKAMKI